MRVHQSIINDMLYQFLIFPAKGVMAGSVATLALLWISLQGMGFLGQPSGFIDASKLPISLHNYLASYTGNLKIRFKFGFVKCPIFVFSIY